MRVDFGCIRVGRRSKPRTVTVPNTGLVPLRVQRSELVGPNAGEFQVVTEDYSGVDVYPGRSCSIVLRFAPKESGVRRAVLVLHTDSPDSPWRVVVTGYAPSGTRQQNDLPAVTFERRVLAAPPVAIRAEADAGAASVFCGRRRIRGGGREPSIVQELDILVPVRVEVSGVPDQPGGREQVTCLAVGRVAVELPLTFGAGAELPRQRAAERP